MPATRLSLMVLLVAALAWPAAVHAQVRAWLDRDRIALGEATTLNIEVQGAGTAPDYAPLAADFELGARSSRQRFEAGAGGARAITLHAIALTPSRAGTVTVPSLAVAGVRTPPLPVAVIAAPATRTARGTVFIETELDQTTSYVQQAVGYVVRLHYATQLLSGELDQDTPDGAELQRVGSDLQFVRELGGRRYTVVERRFVLVPERSGRVVLPSPRFQGRGVGGFFDDVFGDGQRVLSAIGPRRTIEVRAVPDAAAEPWLPVRGLSLRYVDPPATARAGEAATVVVEALVDGANAAQVPALEFGPVDGAQVFAEPAQVDEAFEQGRPQVRVTRRFSVVPAAAGPLRIPGLSLMWWDVAAGRAREAVLDTLVLDVAAAPQPLPRIATDAAAAEPGEAWVRVPGIQGELRPWPLATAVFALLWLVTLMWGLHRGASSPATVTPAAGDGRPRHDRVSTRVLREALAAGDLADVADALCLLAPVPQPADLDAVRAWLDDAMQRDAVDQLQRARWGGGDGAAARAALRRAFSGEPRWRTAAPAPPAPLPPLYPPPGDRA